MTKGDIVSYGIWTAKDPETGQLIELGKRTLDPISQEIWDRSHSKKPPRWLACADVAHDTANHTQEQRLVYLRELGGVHFASHKDGSKGHRRLIPAGMSEQHKRQQEYDARCADRVGLSAELEKTLRGQHGRNARRADLLVADMLGLEIQLTGITPSGVTSRTNDQRSHGVTTVWQIVGDEPLWARIAPSVRTNRLHPGEERQPRVLPAIGPSLFVAQRCTSESFGRCPKGGSRARHCGKWHAKRRAYNDPDSGLPALFVDDIIWQVPAGELVPLAWIGRDQKGRLRQYQTLTTPKCAALYDELMNHIPLDVARPFMDPTRTSKNRVGRPHELRRAGGTVAASSVSSIHLDGGAGSRKCMYHRAFPNDTQFPSEKDCPVCVRNRFQTVMKRRESGR